MAKAKGRRADVLLRCFRAFPLKSRPLPPCPPCMPSPLEDHAAPISSPDLRQKQLPTPFALLRVCALLLSFCWQLVRPWHRLPPAIALRSVASVPRSWCRLLQFPYRPPVLVLIACIVPTIPRRPRGALWRRANARLRSWLMFSLRNQEAQVPQETHQVQIGPIAPSVRLHNTVHNVRRHGERAGEVRADNILERLLRGAGLRHNTPLREHRKYRRHRHVCWHPSTTIVRRPPNPLLTNGVEMFCMSRSKN